MLVQGSLDGGGDLRYRPDFRLEAVEQIGRWVLRQKSGAVVGLAGAGKSNFVQFICEESGQVCKHLPEESPSVALVPIDLNNLVDLSLSTLYRVILRAFYYHRAYFPKKLGESVVRHYEAVRNEQDPFVSQSALYELLFTIRDNAWRVVLVLDRFDAFAKETTPELTNTLRALRDSFKRTLSYFLVMRQETIYLPDPILMGELVEIVDTHVCWIGAMSEQDAHYFIEREMLYVQQKPRDAEITEMLALSGRFASVLKAVCDWWVELSSAQRASIESWPLMLNEHQPVQFRLKEIWKGLNQEERHVLISLHLGKAPNLQGVQQAVLERMEAKGVLLLSVEGWSINGRLLAKFVETVIGTGLGRVWLDENTGNIFQGNEELNELRPLERAMLLFFVQNPHRQHSKTDLIEAVWPDDVHRDGVTDDSLYQVVRGLRKKIEPNPSKPTYVVSRRGQPESGYQFYPQGQPNG